MLVRMLVVAFGLVLTVACDNAGFSGSNLSSDSVFSGGTGKKSSNASKDSPAQSEGKDGSTSSQDSAGKSLGVLWPPNHKMVALSLSDEADLKDKDCKISKITSDEPEDAQEVGDEPGDWTIGDGLSFELRSERLGSSDGRVYTVTATCKVADEDQSYNYNVQVPHDLSDEATRNDILNK